MRSSLWLLLSFLALAPSADAQYDQRGQLAVSGLHPAGSLSRPPAAPEPYSPYARAIVDQVIPTKSPEDLILGGAMGWIAGLAAGAAVGYAIQPDAGDSWIGAGEWWLGALVGSSAGAATGVHLANGRSGDLLLSSGGALLSVPVALLVAVPLVWVHGAGILLVPVAQIGTSILLERRTSRR
jgi:hypothetical protein